MKKAFICIMVGLATVSMVPLGASNFAGGGATSGDGTIWHVVMNSKVCPNGGTKIECDLPDRHKRCDTANEKDCPVGGFDGGL